MPAGFLQAVHKHTDNAAPKQAFALQVPSHKLHKHPLALSHAQLCFCNRRQVGPYLPHAAAVAAALTLLQLLQQTQQVFLLMQAGNTVPKHSTVPRPRNRQALHTNPHPFLGGVGRGYMSVAMWNKHKQLALCWEAWALQLLEMEAMQKGAGLRPKGGQKGLQEPLAPASTDTTTVQNSATTTATAESEALLYSTL